MEKQFIDLSTIIGKEEHSLPISQEPLYQDDKYQYIQRKQEDPKKRKLRLQYIELQRKQKIHNKILEKQSKVNKRLSLIKNQHELNKTLYQKQINRRLCTQKKENSHKEQQFKSSNLKWKNQQPSHIQLTPNSGLSQEKITIPKQNIIKIYAKTAKNKHSLNVLPRINRQKAIEDFLFSSKPKQPLNIINFGIFSQHKNIQNFLHKLKQTLTKQFIFQIDLKNQENFNHLQSVIMKAVYQEAKQFL